jgi:Ca2+-binding RTX toxin-like protein
VYTESGLSVDVSSVGRVSDDISPASLSTVPQSTDTITSIMIGEIPVGAIVSDGVNFSDGVGTTQDIVGWDYSDLTINLSGVLLAPAADTAITFTLNATATSETDKTATASGTVSIGVLADNYLEDGVNAVDSIISNSVVADSDDLEIVFAANDTITAGTQGAVVLDGLAGDDVLNGEDSHLLDGSLNGNNLIFGGAGNDIIVSGIGSDVLTCGFSGGGVESDTDTFLWRSGDQGTGSNGVNLETDTITDFFVDSTSSDGDILDLSQHLIGATTDAITNYVSLTESAGNTLLSIDINGDGSGTDFNVQLNGVTGTDINTIINNGNIAFDEVNGNALRGSMGKMERLLNLA